MKLSNQEGLKYSEVTSCRYLIGPAEQANTTKKVLCLLYKIFFYVFEHLVINKNKKYFLFYVIK